MNIRRVLFALLMVTVFIVPLLAGLIAAGIGTAAYVGFQGGNECLRWLLNARGRP